MKPNVRVVLQARTSSRRLPAKVLLPVAGIPLAVLAAKRAMRNGRDLVVATSVADSDNLLAGALERQNIQVSRGPLDDVLKRFVLATNDLRETDVCVRLTADNPFPDGDLVDELVSKFRGDCVAYMSASDIVDFEMPIGLSAEVFRVGALRNAEQLALEPRHREHVTTYIREHLAEPAVYKNLGIESQTPGLRCTIDTLEDYLQVAGFFSAVADPVGQKWEQLLAAFQDYSRKT